MSISFDFSNEELANANNEIYKYLKLSNTLYTIDNERGVSCVKYKVGKISDKNMIKLKARDRLNPIKISTLDKRYVKDINGVIYDTNFIKRKKDTLNFKLPNEGSNEFYIYKILTFDYVNITRQSLCDIYPFLRS